MGYEPPHWDKKLNPFLVVSESGTVQGFDFAGFMDRPEEKELSKEEQRRNQLRQSLEMIASGPTEEPLPATQPAVYQQMKVPIALRNVRRTDLHVLEVVRKSMRQHELEANVYGEILSRADYAYVDIEVTPQRKDAKRVNFDEIRKGLLAFTDVIELYELGFKGTITHRRYAKDTREFSAFCANHKLFGALQRVNLDWKHSFPLASPMRLHFHYRDNQDPFYRLGSHPLI